MVILPENADNDSWQALVSTAKRELLPMSPYAGDSVDFSSDGEYRSRLAVFDCARSSADSGTDTGETTRDQMLHR